APEVERSDVLIVGIEEHLSGDTVVIRQASEGVSDSAFIQSSTADRVEQYSHFVVSKRRKMIGPVVVPRFVARDKLQPLRVTSARIKGINRLKAFGGRPRQLDEFVTDRAMAAENPLLHSQFLHLLQD